MNPVQPSNSENLPPSFTNIPQYNNVPTISSRQDANAFHVTTAENIHPRYVTLNQLATHPTTFFYSPPNEFCHYYVKCKEICYNTVTYLLNKLLKENNVQSNENRFIFYYQQQHDARFYQVSCEIVSPFSINNRLNKNFLGFEFQQVVDEKLTFTFEQKENLESFLNQYLSQYILN
ncbi:unnamed protein product [Rhizophagus irregularis]|uniref:Uncharacterized protein n=1 Tax=Rhizophagus irregularis TaxID=588596 RepID=A0A2I1H0J4_9GLOM|nr:hypothetical protein RhiirA4_470008 [Rhizophagus irregularis]CAB4443180.1 unnamed protein product [Rhizophagus irregularis]CAB4443237.1 unnamed protein product [Rhizophagus irregularis]